MPITFTQIKNQVLTNYEDELPNSGRFYKKRDGPRLVHPPISEDEDAIGTPSTTYLGATNQQSTSSEDQSPFAWPPAPVVAGRKDAAYVAMDPADRVKNIDFAPVCVGANGTLCEVVTEHLLQVAYSEGQSKWRWLDTKRKIDAPYASIEALCDAFVHWWFDQYGDELLKLGEIDHITPALRTEVIGRLSNALGVSAQIKMIKETTADADTGEETEITRTKVTRIGVGMLHEDVCSITLPQLVKHRAAGTLHHNPIGGERRRKLVPITQWDETFLGWLNGVLANVFQYTGESFISVEDATKWLRNTWRVNPSDPTAWGIMWLARSMHNFGERGSALLWLYGGGGVGKSTILDWTGDLMNPPQAQRVAKKSNGEDLGRGWTDTAINNTTAFMVFDDLKRHHYYNVLDTLKPALGGATVASCTTRHVGTTEVDLITSYAVASNSLPHLDNEGNAWDRRITILESVDLDDHSRNLVSQRVATLMQNKERLLDQLNWFYYQVGRELDLSATQQGIPTVARHKAFACAKSLAEELVLGDELNNMWGDLCWTTPKELVTHLLKVMQKISPNDRTVTRDRVRRDVDSMIRRGVLITPTRFDEHERQRLSATLGGGAKQVRNPIIRAPSAVRAAGEITSSEWLSGFDASGLKFRNFAVQRCDFKCAPSLETHKILTTTYDDLGREFGLADAPDDFYD